MSHLLLTTRTCLRCKSEFTCYLYSDETSNPLQCAACFVSTDLNVELVMAAAFYGIPTYRLVRLHACITSGHSRNNDGGPAGYRSDRECMDCWLTSFRKSDGTWPGIYFRNIEIAMSDYHISWDQVATRLNELSRNQATILSGR